MHHIFLILALQPGVCFDLLHNSPPIFRISRLLSPSSHIPNAVRSFATSWSRRVLGLPLLLILSIPYIIPRCNLCSVIVSTCSNPLYPFLSTWPLAVLLHQYFTSSFHHLSPSFSLFPLLSTFLAHSRMKYLKYVSGFNLVCFWHVHFRYP